MAKPTNDQRLTKSLQLKISNLRAEAAHLVTLAGEREKQANQLQALIVDLPVPARPNIASNVIT